MIKVIPVTLDGDVVRLRPLRMEDAGELASVGLEPELWELQPRRVVTEEDMHGYVRAALDEAAAGIALPFAIVDRSSGAIVGSTRYADIVRPHRRLEIGWTWLIPRYQRTGANTEAKLLLLTHAFEALDAMRVTFKTDALNVRSRTAILRIGAVEEGTFRRHVVCDDGRIRDTVYFSIVDTEWPRIKTDLQNKLARNGAKAGR